jgi:hypothetical protein
VSYESIIILFREGDRKRLCTICFIAVTKTHDYYQAMTNIILSAATFTAIILLYGAFRLWRRDGSRLQAVLMIIAAVIIAGNIAIWTVPDRNGQSLVNSAQ